MAAALSAHLGDVQMPGPLVAAAARAGPLQQRDQLHGGDLGPGAGHVTRDTWRHVLQTGYSILTSSRSAPCRPPAPPAPAWPRAAPWCGGRSRGHLAEAKYSLMYWLNVFCYFLFQVQSMAVTRPAAAVSRMSRQQRQSR